jgi:hypothetical protein
MSLLVSHSRKAKPSGHPAERSQLGFPAEPAQERVDVRAADRSHVVTVVGPGAQARS